MATTVFGQAPDRQSSIFHAPLYNELEWRNVGPMRGGRSVAVSGVPGNPMTYFMGTTGGGLWKTTDGGIKWKNISDGHFNSGSVGAIAIAPSNTDIIYAGMGEHAVRGVMTSHGDGMYKSEDGGKTWKYIGLPDSRHIASINIHPEDPDKLFVAVQGALYGPTEERGVYKSEDGGENWRKVLYVNETTGACDLSMDAHNPEVLYAGMWDHQRFPWKIRSGGNGSGLYKSTDFGESWHRLYNGLPKSMGKVGISVSPADPNVVYANIEAENGGVFRSDDGGELWQQVNSERVTYARSWYYMEIFADPKEKETVYVLNAPMLKSIDGGQTFERIKNPHGDQHDLWINPDNPGNRILGNDGGA
ncbi:MAG: glycosyl hydrolase, partial [Bacteroidetes bacterium]